ncbi:MAG: MBL fold metallo-hydrolase, partial [Clostridia bacterium]|nr:MBL fold metallo-hydrolase [Clostridia bacterium]
MKIIQHVNKTHSQMMAYTVVSKSGHVLVIDGGETGDTAELKRVINKVGGHVHLWLISHPHCDHHNAIIALLND